MHRQYPMWFLSFLLFFLSATTVQAGGPPIVTFEKLPEYFVVGEPFTLKFVVRSYCCNHAPLENSYTVRAVLTDLPAINVFAAPTKTSGEYEATLTLPHSGPWTITVEIPKYVFAALQPIPAIPPGATEPPALSQVAKGERLFLQKGCARCHINRDVSTPAIRLVWTFETALVGGPPDLTGKKFAADYLRKYLNDPRAARRGATMPRLSLTADDVDSLVAFINR